MDQNKPDLTVDESVNQVMRTLPPVVRSYLVQGKHTAVAKNLMTKYGLRIDQAGVLEQEIILLIMGIDNPDEFTQVLAKDAKLDAQTINSITKDVNEQIFIPLREEMRKGGGSIEPVKPATPASPRPSPEATVGAAKATQGTVQGNVPVPRYFHLENKIHPAPSMATKTTIPAPTSPKATQGTAVESRKLLEDHEEPHIDIRDKVQGVSPPTIKTPSPVADSPLRQALRTVMPPRPAITLGAGGPPPNLPGVIQHPPLPRPAVASSGVGPRPPAPLPPHASPVATQGTAPLSPPSPPQISKPIVSKAPYSADPYREPIE
ncbi:MAG: hypothetical protein Q7R58_02275 [bacterium]|nr:hypothetical protein [bacterium]